jgi:hypothetical protein
MIRRRQILLIIAILAVALVLPGCDIFRRARRVQAEPPPPFQSPITQVIGHPGMSAADIAAAIKPRQADTRSILGSLSVIVGEQRSRTRMQFDANMYYAPPDFLRVRGSADQGTLFDFLMRDGQAQVMLVPEKKVHSGTVAALRNNPTLMGGVQPDDLVQSFMVDHYIYRILSDPASGAVVRETQDHFAVSVAYVTGVTETYSIRMSDLLVDKIERTANQRALGSVRFDGYAFYGREDSKMRHLLPNRFEALLPTGAVATVQAVDLQPNAKREEALTIMNVPPDFQRLPL